MSILFLLLGAAMIIFGANGLVSGASSIAKRLGISDFVIGLTIVGMGTSAPELTINVIAALKGSTGIAIGNALGSNISNILLILGISAIIFPLTISNSARWREIPISLIASLVLLVLANDMWFNSSANNIVSFIDGIILLILMAIFLWYTFKQSKKQNLEIEKPEKTVPYWKSISFIILGLAALFWGGQFFVDGAVEIARMLGMSERVIGLTIVAIGTSLPELATSVVAAIKKQSDIAIGNVVGSNIFNIFFILGTTSVISPLPFDKNSNFDIYVTIFASLLLFFTTFTLGRKKLDRIEGVIFLIIYAAYLIYII